MFKILRTPEKKHNPFLEPILLLLANGFFMGIFLATYTVSAETLFLNKLGHYLKEAILLSGFLGMITTGLFSYLQNKISYAWLANFNLIFILIFSGAMYYLTHFSGGDFQNYVVFAMFSMIGPITAVSILGFWGIFGRLFDLRQSKKIVGWIDSGQLIAAIITLYTIPFLEPLVPDTTDFLLVTVIAVFVSLIFLVFITTRHDLKGAEIGSSKVQVDEGAASFRGIFKDKYVILLSVFVLFSMGAFTFVQYSFQEVAQLQYPEENELRSFLAIFNGSVLFLGLIMQTFVNDKIISDYGLKVALLVLPVILTVFTVGAIFFGNFYGFVPTDSPETFVFFFVFVILSRLFNYAIRDALENPTLKLYFMPLDNRIRFSVQTKVEGVINEGARFIAAGLIFALAAFAFIELIHYTYAVMFLLIGYFLLANKLYKGYREKIKVKLENQEISSEKFRTLSDTVLHNLENNLKNEVASKAVFSFKMMEKINPRYINSSINTLMKHETEEVRDFAQARVNELKGLSVSDKYILRPVSFNGELIDKNTLSDWDLNELLTHGDISKSRIARLAKSDKSEDRLYAAELIGHSDSEQSIGYLVDLMLDTHAKVRITAIKTAQKRNNHEVINVLIENLGIHQFSNQAMSTLVTIGEKSLPNLDSAFYKSGQNSQTMVKIVRTIGRIGGEMAMALLWNRIDYPDKGVVAQVLVALGDSRFKAGMTQISRIKAAIESDISDIAWNLAAIGEVDTEILKDALRDEIKNDIEHIYTLLSMLYDARSIQLVKENIESGTPEGNAFAIELLDVFLSDDLKQKIIPVLDDIAEADRARKLEVFFPRHRIDSVRVLKFLINRDYNQTNRWTKSCAIIRIGELKQMEFEYDIIANLFNPDKLVREAAAWSLHQMDPALYKTHVQRLDVDVRRSLNKVIAPANEDNGVFSSMLEVEKVLFLKGQQVFRRISGLTLSYVADFTHQVVLKEGQTLAFDSTKKNSFFIIHTGMVNLYEQSKVRTDLGPSTFIGELMENSHFIQSNLMVALEDTSLFEIDKDSFYELLGDYPEFTNEFLTYI
jgi:ATP:ADP antiporter, AAA family